MKLEWFCIKFLRIGVYASMVAPAIVFPWTIYPYLYGKALFINIITAILFPFYIMLIQLRPDFRPKKNILVGAISIFLVVLFVSAIFGEDLRRSFWGTQERSAGLFFILHYFILFFIASSVFRDYASWKKLLGFSLVVSVVVMGSTWWDIAMDKIMRPGAGTRTGGALSNPIFYAAYLLFHIPIALWLFLDTKKKLYKWILGIIFFAEVISMFFALTRGAMVAFVVMTFVALFLFGVFNTQYRTLTLGALGCLVVSIILVFVFRDITSKVPILERFTSISPRDITAHTRLEAWKIAIDGFREHPVFGWGPENYYLIFNKFYNPELLRFSYYETWSDRPHNIFFELLATVGVFGIMSYLGIYGVIFLHSFQRLRKYSIDPKVVIPLLALFAGYFIQNMFGIDTVSTYLLFFICLAFSVFIFLPHEPSSVNPALRAQKDIHVGKSPVVLSGLLSGLVAFISIWQWNIRPAYAGYLTARATAVSTFGEALPLWERALAVKTPWSFDAQVEYVKGVTRLAGQATSEQYNELEPLLIRAEESVRILTNMYPKNAYFNYLTGRFYGEWGRFEFIHFAESENYFKKAIALSPKRQQLFYGLGNMYLDSGRTDEGLRVFRELVDFDPGVDESHMFYGLALRQAGMGEAAYQEIKEALRLGYRPAQIGDILPLAEVATKENNLEWLQVIYEGAIGLEPTNADWYARLAALYLELGKKEDARRMVLRAVELDVTLKEEANIFLKLLE